MSIDFSGYEIFMCCNLKCDIFKLATALSIRGCIPTRMTKFIKAKLKKSYKQTNIEKYRVVTQIVISEKNHINRAIISYEIFVSKYQHVKIKCTDFRSGLFCKFYVHL